MMDKYIIKKSKKGFSLPAAIGITAVLIILSASLIIIAASSIANTSIGINKRQAYLNVHSALNYARAYYENDSSFVSGNDIAYQYMIMKDIDGGTVNDGADISDDETSVDDATTYVIAEYIPATKSTDNTAKLKLKAFSNYYDAFNKKSEISILSQSWQLGGFGSGENTIIDPEITPNFVATDYSENITLNIKKRPDQSWGSIAYYTWSFEDIHNMYATDSSGNYTDPNNSSAPKTSNSYEYVPNLEHINDTETDSHIVFPAGKWVASGSKDKLGPSALVSESGGGWLSSSFIPSKNYVNYFNIIFANKGAVLSQGKNTQTCEMFHLWYLDPSDKNVYFEFLKSEPYYRTGSDWNGKDYIEDTMLVYVTNPKTTVHFKIKGVDDTAVATPSSKPKINSVTVNGSPISGSSYLGKSSKEVNNLEMTYEGCGWWVANIETDDTFKMNITYAGSDPAGMTVTVTPNSDNEAWVYADPNAIASGRPYGTIQSRLSESNANIALGVSSDSYVTIHAQTYNKNKQATPKLNYKDVELNSSTGRIKLYNKILEAYQYSAENYTDESYAVLQTALNEAVTMYNDIDFIKNQTGPTNAEKITQADAKYEAKVTELDNAINALVGKTCDVKTLKQLLDLVKQGDDIVAAQTSKGKYDITNYGVFVAVGGAYQEAKKMIKNPDLKKGDADDQIDLLQKALDEINKHVLDRSQLKTLINKAESLSKDTRYEQSYREELSKPDNKYGITIDKAKTLHDQREITQTELNDASTKLQAAINDIEAHVITPLNTTKLSEAIDGAEGLIALYTETKLNCTDETFNNLQTAINTAKAKMSAKTQPEIDAATAELANATSLFVVVKPKYTNDFLNNEKQIRVWIDRTEDYTCELRCIQRSDDSGSVITVDIVTDGKLLKDEASGLSYYDVNKETHGKVEFIFSFTDPDDSTNTISVESNQISLDDITDNNLVIKCNVDKINKTCDIKAEKLTTLYIEKKTLPDTSNTPLVKVNDKEVTISSDGVDGSFYYTAKFVSEDNQKVVIYSKSDGTGTNTDPFKVSAGQFVVRHKTDKDVELINVKNIYTKYETTTASSTGYRISGAAIDAENLISPTILSNITDSYSISLTDTGTGSNIKEINEIIDIPVPAGKTLVFIDTTGVDFKGKTPYGYFWNHDKADIGAAWPGLPLLRYEDTNYYYSIVSNNVKGLIISRVNGGKDADKIGGDVILQNKHQHYVYITVDSNNSGKSFKVDKTSYTAPTITRQIAEVTLDDMTEKNLEMAFVGGNKVRITNKSYVETYGSNKKWNQTGTGHSLKLTDSNPFGGTGANERSMYRVGDSQLSPYYDWYEFKIPVNSLADYTFDISGLRKNGDTNYIQQVSKAYGDIWVTLDGSHTDSNGRYDNVSIYTFDPEKKQMEYVYDVANGNTVEKTRIYFNRPTGWSNATLTVAGIGTEETFNLDVSGYADVDIHKPFLTFTVQDDSSPAKTHVYKTSLQGGDTVLFDPTMNGGYGSWNDYVSPQTKLKREILKAQTLYYGSLIVGKYDDDGYVADNGDNTYNYAEKLKETYKIYTRYYQPDGSKMPDSDKPDGTINLKTVYSKSDANATNAYNALVQWVDAYENLYSVMSKAKAYIKEPITGVKNSDGNNIHPATSSGKYPEYDSNAEQNYTDTSIGNLKSTLASAEAEYISTSATVSNLNSKANELQNAIDSLDVNTVGVVKVIFYDAQGKVNKGSTFKVSYKNSGSSTETVVDVTAHNSQNFPVALLEADGNRALKNVQFLVDGSPVGIAADKILSGTTWIYYDLDGAPKWQELPYEYVPMNQKVYKQTGTNPYNITMKHKMVEDEANPDMTKETSEYRKLVLYFKYDTKVECSAGNYEIKAGAYTFRDEDTKESTSPFYGGTFNLYSAEAKTYFETPKNYGMIDGAEDAAAASVKWIDASGVLTGAIKTTANPVNVTVKSATINTIRKYTSLQQMYFRYENNDSNFVVRSSLTLTASEFVIASSSTINGANTISPHFYLNNIDPSAQSLLVNFKSHMIITYKDSTGASRSFTIPAGRYRLSKAYDDKPFIADFFDEDYWLSGKVEPLDEGGSKPGKISFSGGLYSND